MSVKIKAKNPSGNLQVLTCNALGELNTTGAGGGGGSDMTATNLILTDIEGKTYNRTRTNLTFLNQTILTNANSSVFNLSSTIYNKCRLWGVSDRHHDLTLEFSNDNSTWSKIQNVNVLNFNSNYTFNLIIDLPPKYLRLNNHSAHTITLDTLLELSF